MNKICIILIYFGVLPQNFPLWQKSCAANHTIEFLIITDQKLHSNSMNIKVVNMTLRDFKTLADNALNMDTALYNSYKCCDFRPAYGLILKDYLIGYDFWGHCDCDLVFGNIRKFVTEDILEKYDKIYALGHLSLYRNTTANNSRFKLNGVYKQIFNSRENSAFDELNGILQIYLHNNINVYLKLDYADIGVKNKRFLLSDLIVPGCKNRPNFANQVFYWENGGVFRAYKDNDHIKVDEFVYIHFQKRKNMIVRVDDSKTSSYYIGPKGFFEKSGRYAIRDDIEKYNEYHGNLYEKIEVCFWYFQNLSKRINNRLKRMWARYV